MVCVSDTVSQGCFSSYRLGDNQIQDSLHCQVGSRPRSPLLYLANIVIVVIILIRIIRTIILEILIVRSNIIIIILILIIALNIILIIPNGLHSMSIYTDLPGVRG